MEYESEKISHLNILLGYHIKFNSKSVHEVYRVPITNSKLLGKERNLPSYVEHKIDHYRQKFNWDCGVACVIMLLQEDKREDLLRHFSQVCQEEGFGQSTWTIDLCYMLKRFRVQHCMYTTMMGVNEDYRRQGYYNKIINMDRERVKRRFDEATSSGIEVQERSITIEELMDHLAFKGPVISLVDAGLLVCDLCKHNKLKAEFRRCFGGGYTGHYILLVGYNIRNNKVLYRDPALPARLCAVSLFRLKQARLATGTDEDVIFIFNNYR